VEVSEKTRENWFTINRITLVKNARESANMRYVSPAVFLVKVFNILV
jgi:hypothetical protein